MSRDAIGRALAVLLMAGLAAPVAVRADDDPEELARKLVEKFEKAFRKAEKAQLKAAEKASKREREAQEKLTEEQREARKKEAKARRKAALSQANRLKDPGGWAEEALDDFDDRVDDYVDDIHKKALKQVGELPKDATPEQMLAHERALGDVIRAMRQGARQGDLIVPEAQAVIRAIIAEQMDGRVNDATRKEALNGNPSLDPDRDDRMRVPMTVNTVYPERAPLSNVPPTVLLSLPLLKKEVEYRFVGRDLVLRDRAANLILDYVPQAAPNLAPTAAAAKPPAPPRKR